MVAFQVGGHVPLGLALQGCQRVGHAGVAGEAHAGEELVFGDAVPIPFVHYTHPPIGLP